MYKYTSQKNLKSPNAPGIYFVKNVASPAFKGSSYLSPQNKTNQENSQSSKKQLNYFSSVKNLNNYAKVGSPIRNSYKSPQQMHKSSKHKDQQSKPIRQQFRTLKIALLLDVYGPREALFFYFDNETRCSELIAFLYEKIVSRAISGSIENFYFESGNFHLDYFIALKDAKVCEIPADAITLRLKRINVTSIGWSLKMFELVKCIGSGGFSKVFLARAYGILMAIKVIPKKIILQTGKQSIIEHQKFILQNCGGHPFITKLYTSFETEKYIIFGMEYCNGGQLFNLLRKVKRMSEQQARFYFLQTLAAIAHLHSNKIVYRDLKPENIIIDFQGHVRLADFGLSKIMTEQRTYSFCGSAEYMAPEMLMKKGHSYEVDYYCLGALMYELVTGLPPYYSRDQNQLFTNIISQQLTFPENVPISKTLKVFLTRLLSKDTEERFNSIQQMFTYQWLKGVSMTDILAKKMTPPYPTKNFYYNFDDSEFADEQEMQMIKLELEKEAQQSSDPMMGNFVFQSEEISNIRTVIEQQQTKDLFSNKRRNKDKLLMSSIQNGVLDSKPLISNLKMVKKASKELVSPTEKKPQFSQSGVFHSPKPMKQAFKYQNVSSNTGEKFSGGKTLLKSVKSNEYLKHNYQNSYLNSPTHYMSSCYEHKKQISQMGAFNYASISPRHPSDTVNSVHLNQIPRVSIQQMKPANSSNIIKSIEKPWFTKSTVDNPTAKSISQPPSRNLKLHSYNTPKQYVQKPKDNLSSNKSFHSKDSKKSHSLSKNGGFDQKEHLNSAKPSVIRPLKEMSPAKVIYLQHLSKNSGKVKKMNANSGTHGMSQSNQLG